MLTKRIEVVLHLDLDEVALTEEARFFQGVECEQFSHFWGASPSRGFNLLHRLGSHSPNCLSRLASLSLLTVLAAESRN